MLDGWIRRRIDPLLDPLGQWLARAGISADATTLAGLGVGLAAALMIPLRLDAVALLLFILNRLLDGLDGAIARSTRRTDRGGFLDNVLDFAVYGAIPLAFALRDPDALALPAAALLFSFYISTTSFLAFAAVAAKRGMSSDIRGIKSIYFTAGIMQGTGTFLFFAAMLLFPQLFPILAYALAGLTLMGALTRVTLAWHAFRDEAEESD